ncbi:kinase-like domain-containing protein [Podospora australis]|uniref:Kinase-like domain-containing protein n=1 Tax=Podospora australis TaxID=1536484 RepID=A0AAN6WXV7_9PEZI|nr:kinase-like domain-containing protein [Podospora australis]
MLAGNLLQSLPAEMASCKNLALLRLSANNFSELPSWLFTLPQLAFLSFAGNPCASSSSANGTRTPFGLAHVPWSDLEVQHTLGSGASGVISQALWKQTPEYVEEVAVKLFRGSLTSDGTPADEMAACLAAGCHESLITILGKIHDHPEEEGMLEGGLVMQLIPDSYKVLGQPPSLDTCTRDLFPSESTERLQTGTILSMLTGIAGAAAHLHERGIAHGDLYAHNILASKEDAHALLGDFGAATIYGVGSERDCEIEKLEVLAFAHLLEDMLGLVSEDDDSAEGEGVESEPLRKRLWELQKKCSVPDVGGRPSFEEILEELEGMMGWRGMMRIPTIPN